MASPPPMKGITTGTFFPAPGTYPDYPVAGEIQPPAIDEQGNLATRGPTTTDEGGVREPFNGTSLSPDWTAVTGTSAGASITVANSLVTISSGTGSVGATSIYITREIDFLPIAVNVYFRNNGLPTKGASAGVDFFWGFYSDEDPALAAEFVEWLWPGNTAVGQSNFVSGTGPAASERETLVGGAASMRNSNANGWSSILLSGESAIYRDNTLTTLPTATVRDTKSIQIPGLYTHLHLAFGFRLTAGAGKTAWSVALDTLFVKNTNILLTSTVF